MFDQVISLHNLHLAFKQVKKNGGAPGIDGQTVEQFEANLEENLQCLHRELRTGTYRPKPVRRAWTPKEGTSEMRPLGIPTVRDRVVQTALLLVLEPLFDPGFAEHSNGFRKGRGCHDALRQVMGLLEAGYVHVVDADIQKFFDNINHTTLLDLIRKKVREEQILRLIWSFLKVGVLEGGIIMEPEFGTPQGGPLSPLLANIYLDPLDHFMVEQGLNTPRYADDFLVLSRTSAEAMEARELVRVWLEGVGLSLNLKKTRIVDPGTPGGFDYLGYNFYQQVRQPRPRNLNSLRDKIREQTMRSRRVAEPETIIKNLNEVLAGWIHYFQLTTDPEPFLELDIWIRKRISNIRCLRPRRNDPQLTNLITKELVSLHRTWERLRNRSTTKDW